VLRVKAQTVIVFQYFVFFFNARSILPKLDELKVLAEDNNPDVICITVS